MKIRIYNNTVRLRLERSEVEDIGRGSAVDCHTQFASGDKFGYRLSVSDVDEVGATFTAGCIEVTLPRPVATNWAEDETQVSINGANDLATGQLELLIEKDFECLEPRPGESQENRFRNPKAIC